MNWLQRFAMNRDPQVKMVKRVIAEGTPGCRIRWRSNNGPISCQLHHGDRHWWVGPGPYPAYSFIAFGAETQMGAHRDH